MVAGDGPPPQGGPSRRAGGSREELIRALGVDIQLLADEDFAWFERERRWIEHAAGVLSDVLRESPGAEWPGLTDRDGNGQH